MAPNLDQLKGFLNETHFSINIDIKTEPLDLTYNVDARPFARGKFAQVRRCLHKQTGVEYAGKVIKKRRRSSDVRHEIIHEVAVLLLAQSNKNIVNLHEVYETSTEFILILEMMEEGELQRFLDEEESIKEKDVIKLMRQILSAVQFLHNNNIAHLDIKPQNLLLSKSLPESEVKLCDFGISRVITPGTELREIVGTPDYVAPEILHYEPITLATDMWSVGVLTYVLLTGYSPFGGETKQETYSNITNSKLEFGSEFDKISPSAVDFIKQLLIKRPEQRMTAQQCLEHRWLSECNEIEIGDSNPVKILSTTSLLSSSSSSIESPSSPSSTTTSTTTNPSAKESNKENQALDDYCADIIKDKAREYFILKMTQPNTSESKSVPSTPSCKRFILTGEEKTPNRSSSSERKTQMNEKNSSIYFESNSSISSFSSASSFDKKLYHLVFCEDIRDERVSYIY